MLHHGPHPLGVLCRHHLLQHNRYPPTLQCFIFSHSTLYKTVGAKEKKAFQLSNRKCFLPYFAKYCFSVRFSKKKSPFSETNPYYEGGGQCGEELCLRLRREHQLVAMARIALHCPQQPARGGQGNAMSYNF